MDTIAFRPDNLVSRMQTEMDYSPVLQSLVAEGFVADMAEAESNLQAFIQWIALAPSVASRHPYVMLKCPIDDVFHVMIENKVFYDQFCSTFFGFHIQHHPFTDEVLDDLDNGVAFTISKLEETYKDRLHPSLQGWRDLVNSGAYVVSCKPKSCPDSHMSQTVVGDLASGGHIVH